MRANDPGREHADHEPEEQPDADLLDDQRRQVADAVVRTLDPGDQAERQCDRDGVVAARLRLERAGEAAAQPGAAERREHGRRIGRRDDGAEEERLRPGEVEEEVREAAGDAGGDDDTDRREQRRGNCDAAQPAPRGRKTPLIEDRDERDDADFAGDGRVVEGDASRAVGAEHHAEAEEGHQCRQTGLGGAECERHAGREHRAHGEHRQPDGHVSTTISLAAPASACARPRRPRAARTRLRCRDRASGAPSRARARGRARP